MPPEQRNHLTPYGFLLIIFYISSSFISTNHACNKMDQDSLWSSFDLPPSPLNWSSHDCCYWEGITCDVAGRITHLLLPSKGLKGGILPSLGNLTHLTHLNLSHNSLYGSLESEWLVSLDHLEILDLSHNLLFGELPLSLPSSYIQIVDLSSNRFKGTIPSSFLQQAWNLISLNASNNLFTGQIPSTICLYSSSVRLMDFSFNGFSGIIPLGLEKCSKLEVFRAGFNNLSGVLPNDIYNARTLQEISLPSNEFFGPISDSIVNLPNLTILELYYNKLSGMLPLHIGKLSKLKLVLLHFNNLEGFLPPSLMNCTNLIELILGFNYLGGDISALNFSKLTQLSKLDLVANHFTGIMPISIYSCKSLKALRLSSNDVEAQIQPEIIALRSLSFLSLTRNRLTNVTRAMKILRSCKSLTVLILSYNFLGEEIPNRDGMIGYGFQNLRVLALFGCQFTGQIPVWMSSLKKLKSLDLSFNRLTGSIPSWLGTLPSLFYVNLNNNSLSGEFPNELCRLQGLVSQKAATQTDHGYFELPIYPIRIYPIHKNPIFQYKNLSNIPTTINLSNNSLRGNIPLEIGQLQLLQQLDLSGNNFSGNIPNQMSSLPNLEKLDLSRNHLSGEIPSSLSRLHFLSSFTVAYNNLQGQIPSGTQLQGFNAMAFEGNPGLCGAPLPNECQQKNATSNMEDLHESKHGVPWFHISVVLGFIVGFWGVCGPLALSRSWRYAYFKFLYNVKNRFLR